LISVSTKNLSEADLIVKYARHDNKAFNRLLSCLRPSGWMEAILLAILDLGALEL